MSRVFIIIVGAICSIIMFLGLFAPWIELQSTPYKLGEMRVKDSIKISGWDLSLGRIQVVQMVESQDRLCWEYYRTLQLQVENRFYPILCLIGGILFSAGAISTIIPKNKVSSLMFLLGGILSLIGGTLGFLDNRWVTPRTIIIEGYTIFGYYGYGLFICTLSSILGILTAFFIWGISENP